MRGSRKLIAQLCTALAGAAMFLPWHANAGFGGADSLRGIRVDEGRIVLAVCIVTIGLVQTGWRPAWIGAGFAGAITIRQILDPSGVGSPDPGFGLWIAAIASVAAVALLVWDMFAGVSGEDGAGPDGGGPGKPPRRWAAGPLGRRR